MIAESFYNYRGGIHPMGKTFFCKRFIPGLEMAVFISESGVEFCTYVGATSSLFGQTTSKFDVEAAIKQNQLNAESDEGTVTPKKRK
jgi:hypothetical protein